MDDERTTVGELREMVRRFVDERDWSQFHDPKNLSMAIAIEAAELMEHFQWLRSDQLAEETRSPEQVREIGEELADVLCFALSLANAMDIDVSSAIAAKIEKNRAKYPPERFRGRFR